ncbi:MAG: isoprenylcysteine carboxylmethyltransferase family protein [bacterium]|nr:isoprenylcysteine carboxylmethyltransferase family protein [bacterium]
MISIKNITMKQIFSCIVALLLIVFSNARPVPFLIGVVIVLLGEIIRFWAAGHLRKDKSLTTTGPYAYVKNPLYIGTLLVTIGMCLCAYNFYILALGLAVLFFQYLPYKLKKESERLEKIFGEEYTEYVRQVPALIPKLTPYRKEGGESKKWSFEQVKGNSEHLTFLAILIGVILISRNLWIR